MITPARRRGVEILDDANVDPDVRRRSLGDVARSNRLLGGRRAARRAVRRVLSESKSASLLDVGSGLADIPEAIRRDAFARGVAITTIGVDEALSLLTATRACLDFAVCASATALPFAD